MKRNWSDDELAEQWSLSPEELALLPNRVGHNRFGFAVQLKFFQIEGRFPRSPREVPAAALRYLSRQLGVSINIFRKYDWRGRGRKDHRAAIRGYLGFRAFTAADGTRLDEWLRRGSGQQGRESCGVEVPAPSVTRFRTASISTARGGNKPRYAWK